MTGAEGTIYWCSSDTELNTVKKNRVAGVNPSAEVLPPPHALPPPPPRVLRVFPNDRDFPPLRSCMDGRRDGQTRGLNLL